MATKKSLKHPHDGVRKELREYGLGLPETETKSPWPDHADLAVRNKTFVYLNAEGALHLSCKLPESCAMALELPFCSPTGYGLGKSGWVTADFEDADAPPLEMLKAWMLESYKAQAPKKLVKLLAQ